MKIGLIDKSEMKDGRKGRKMPKEYKEKELLDFFPRYVNEYNEIPTARDFDNTPGYPSCRTYQKRFGSWSNALKLVELDVESMVKKGIVETIDQKRRFGEVIIRDHFEENPADLAGENKKSPWDGICPNGMKYDVKCSGFDGSQWPFNANNKYKTEIKIYYLLAFNRNYTELIYAWKIPGLIVIDKSTVYVGTSNMSEFNIDNMKEYVITDKIREVLNKYGYFEKIRNHRRLNDIK